MRLISNPILWLILLWAGVFLYEAVAWRKGRTTARSLFSFVFWTVAAVILGLGFETGSVPFPLMLTGWVLLVVSTVLLFTSKKSDA